MKLHFNRIFLLLMILTISGFAQDLPYTSDENTVALWHFDESTGDTAYDASANNHFGIFENGAAHDSSGKFDGCAEFTDSWQRIFVNDEATLDISRELTIDAWINVRPGNNAGVIVGKWNDGLAVPAGQFVFGLNVVRQPYLQVVSDTDIFYIQSDSTMPANIWIKLSAVFDHGRLGLFLNGEKICDGTAWFDTITTLEYDNDDLYIGDLWSDEQFPWSFDGKLDEIRISDIARYPVTAVQRENSQKNIAGMELSQNYPNPFNPATIIRFKLARSGPVRMNIYNTAGQKITTLVDNWMRAGQHDVAFHARGLPAGLYFYQIRTAEFHDVKRMVLLK